MEKSGNYWLYNILQSALRRSGLPTHTYIETQPIHAIARTWELSHHNQADVDVLDIDELNCSYRISSIYKMPITDLDAYLTHATHVWTHSLFNPLAEQVLPKFDKVVYIIRDPRDVAISMARFQFTPYMKTYYPTRFTTPEEHLQATLRRYMLRWQQHVGGYLRHARALNIYIVFYERLLKNFEPELTALLNYLEIDPTPELIAGIAQDVNFQTMQSQNPGHVRRGEANQWVTTLNEDQQAIAVRFAGQMLRLLRYPVMLSEVESLLPGLPDNLEPALIDRVTQPPPPTLRQRLGRALRRVVR